MNRREALEFAITACEILAQKGSGKNFRTAAEVLQAKPITHKPWCYIHKGLNCTCAEAVEPKPEKKVEPKTCKDCIFYEYYNADPKRYYKSSKGDCFNQPPIRQTLKGGDVEWIRPRVSESDPMCERGKSEH